MNGEIHADTTPETWDFMQQHGLNDAHIDSGLLDIPTVGITKTYYSLPTPVRQACEIWGIIYVLKLAILTAQVAANVGALNYLNGRALATYTQPQPPATNAITDAATTGNLEFRNAYFDKEFIEAFSVFQGGVVSTQNEQTGTTEQGQLFLKKPRRIACSQLETQVVIAEASGVVATVIDFTVDILYKFVTVSEQEYNALVALSSGQAVLSEVIVA